MGQCGTLTFQKKWGPLGAPNNFFMIMILKPEQNAIIWSIKRFSSTAHFKVVTWKHAKLFHYAPPPPIWEWSNSNKNFGASTEVKGQIRSFLAKFIIFCEFFTLKKQYMYWNWCMILLCQWSFKWYPFGEDQNNFWTVYGGQRSKKGILGKISHFLCDFLLFKQRNLH